MFFKQESAKIFLSRIEQFLPKTTDPNLMKNLVIELKFDTIQSADKTFIQFLGTLKNKEMNLSPLVENIKKSL